jgi:hypothetical protein
MLLDRAPTDKYMLDLYEWGKSQDELEIAFLIICTRPAAELDSQSSTTRTIALRLFRWSFRMATMMENWIVRLDGVRNETGPLFDIGIEPRSKFLLSRAEIVDQFYGLSEIDVQLVRSLNLDLLIQFGQQEFRGAVLDAARLGCLILDYHDNRASRKVEPGFWEAYYGVPKTRFAIRHLTFAHPNGRTLVSGAFPTKFLFLLNRAHLYQKSSAQLRTLLRKIARTGVIPNYENSAPYSGRSYAPPDLRHTVIYLGKMSFRIGQKVFYKCLNIKQKWGISVIESDWRNAALWRSTQLCAPRGHFWADPFLCPHDGKTYCFVEDFVYATSRGHISVLELTEAGATEIGACIQEDYHLSFPFIFRFEGALYMCPESSEARQVRIYRCASFPKQWELCHIAMDDVSAADSMFFQHGGKWWMMTNIDHSGLEDHCSELYLFSGDSPFESTWVPHPQNPIRIDPEGGRNAGMIIEGGKLFRAAQSQGFDQYGQGLILYEIVEINEVTYYERLVSEITCDFRGGLLGSHHVSTTGKITVFDHVSRCFFP